MRNNRHLTVETAWRGAWPTANEPLAIVIAGRGESVDSALQIADRLALPQLSFAALSAEGASWYPGRFMDPLPINQTDLQHSLERVDVLVEEAETRGLQRARIAVIGFSQGACIASEYLFRERGRWGALIGFTGGLFGPDDPRWDGTGRTLDGTPVLLTNSDIDEWIPWRRTEQTVHVFRQLGANVTQRMYPGREHEVCDAEIAQARELLIESFGSVISTSR